MVYGMPKPDLIVYSADSLGLILSNDSNYAYSMGLGKWFYLSDHGWAYVFQQTWILAT